MKAIRSKVAPRISYRENKTEGIKNYDLDNSYPQRVTDIVNASGVAKRCIEIYKKFIEGRGFLVTEFAEAVINLKGETPNKILTEVAFNYAMRGGFAVHVNYNSLYQITEIHNVPFDYCRQSNNIDNINMIAVYNDWGRRIKQRINKDEIDWLDKFNPSPEVILQQVIKCKGETLEEKWGNYKGQILWFSTNGDAYPLTPYDAVLEDMETDGRIKNHKRKKAATGFNADYAFIHKGKFENDSERQDFVNDLTEYQGDESAGNIMLIELETEEQKPELMKFDKQSEKEDFYTATERGVQDNIRKAFGLPAVLIGENIAGAMGLSSQMKDAYSVFNGLTDSERRIISEQFAKLFKNFERPVNVSGNFDINPVTYTMEEKSQPLAIQFGVGGTTAIQSILIDPAILPPQKINTLIILFGLTEAQASAMINGTPIPENETPQ